MNLPVEEAKGKLVLPVDRAQHQRNVGNNVPKHQQTCKNLPHYDSPIGTASVERSFSQMKLIKTRLRNRIGQSSLSYLMKTAIETSEKLTDEDFVNI